MKYEVMVIDADRILKGFQVPTFPDGIGDAFDQLVQRFGLKNSYYGICSMIDGKLAYYATVEAAGGAAEVVNDESLETLSVKTGSYASVHIANWREKLPLISRTFHEMMSIDNLDRESPAIEWYKSDDDMYCMLRLADK